MLNTFLLVIVLSVELYKLSLTLTEGAVPVVGTLTLTEVKA